MGKYAVEVKDIKKSFFLPNHKNNSIKSAITQAFKPKDKGGKQFNALNGISFNVEKGDFFGILGRNGSGKSTLLKIISEIYQPTSGSVKHDGKVVSFIELGVGFKAELSGRENVYLNGGLLGFSKQEVDEMYDDIVAFAELEEFMDQKLKNYSSGMKVRLAFSVAIRAKADILILDEVLAVGDAAFQKKCYDYFRTLKDDGKTVILVTHGMGAVRDFCNRAIVIEDGKVIFEGGADEAADSYNRLFTKSTKSSDETKENRSAANISASIIGSRSLKDTDTLQIEVKYKSDTDNPVYPKIVLSYRKAPFMAVNAKVSYDITTKDLLEHNVVYSLPLSSFNQGEVSVAALLVDANEEVNVASFGYNNELTFTVKNTETGQKIGGIMRDVGNMELKG